MISQKNVGSPFPKYRKLWVISRCYFLTILSGKLNIAGYYCYENSLCATNEVHSASSTELSIVNEFASRGFLYGDSGKHIPELSFLFVRTNWTTYNQWLLFMGETSIEFLLCLYVNARRSEGGRRREEKTDLKSRFYYGNRDIERWFNFPVIRAEELNYALYPDWTSNFILRCH